MLLIKMVIDLRSYQMWVTLAVFFSMSKLSGSEWDSQEFVKIGMRYSDKRIVRLIQLSLMISTDRIYPSDDTVNDKWS